MQRLTFAILFNDVPRERVSVPEHFTLVGMIKNSECSNNIIILITKILNYLTDIIFSLCNAFCSSFQCDFTPQYW